MENRLKRQIDFIVEIDKMKNVFRKTRLYDHSRYENDAEHGWHMAMMALALAEHANEPDIDRCKVLKMALIHDIVEIDAGDTYLYAPRQESKHATEAAGARRIFGLLPDDLRDEFIALWEEFEARLTPEAKFARAIDRLGPLMQNHRDNGHAWKKHGVTAEQVLAANSIIEDGSKMVWNFARGIIEESIAKGDLASGHSSPPS
jgi:putative hydrolase of HD superfamily